MKAFIFDTETTGLVKARVSPLTEQPEIIEFYGHIVDLDTGKTGKKLHKLFKPAGEITAEISKITGIRPEDVADAPPFAEGAAAICRTLESAPCVIAHNFVFDRSMVDIEMERLGKTVEWPRAFCSMELTMHIKRYRLNLNALHTHLFDEPFAGAHRADADVAALTRCCVELRRRKIMAVKAVK